MGLSAADEQDKSSKYRPKQQNNSQRAHVNFLRPGVSRTRIATYKPRAIIRQWWRGWPNDLIAFSAIKREDERLREMEEAIADGYYLILPFLFISSFFLHIIQQGMADCKPPETKNRAMSASENENSQNDRLKHLKRRIPLLYIATFTCIAIEVTLFLMFVAENYYGGSPTFSPGSKWNADDCSVADYEYKLKHNCTFTDYPNYVTKLEPILIRHIGKLDSFMSSPLEVRQTVWLYESDVIDTAIDNHLELKQYNVDRISFGPLKKAQSGGLSNVSELIAEN
ncbi:hypothetical protein Ddc_10191 [Ditylenchus destructor]|nr:hypothetical protein Ddc_10191 [Ditylenchus destructor]